MHELPLQTAKLQLSMTAVHLQCLNAAGEPINNAVASGFIMKEEDKFYLYTCWHVVTGFDKNNIDTSKDLPNRKYLLVHLQNYEKRTEFVSAIGGFQQITIPLYNENGPAWIQDAHDIPNMALNEIGLTVPEVHDIVKVELPPDLNISKDQFLTPEDKARVMLMPGDKVCIAGFPYGFSALGLTQPTPIVLTRFVAAMDIEGRRMEFLLDGPGAPGMSGGPVFVEHKGGLYLYGMYTGIVYPDHIIYQREKTTALATMTSLLIFPTKKAEKALHGIHQVTICRICRENGFRELQGFAETFIMKDFISKNHEFI